MYIVIGNKIYTTIRNLSFAPEVDITCQQIQSNEFTVEIVTADSISSGARISLYDDTGTMWAYYWIYDCYRLSQYVWRVVARDAVWQLDSKILPAAMYDDIDLSDVIQDIFGDLVNRYGTGIYYLDSTLNDIAISGYAPEQSARERLQQVCFVAGAYIKTIFNSNIQILKLPTEATASSIPADKVFISPIPSYEQQITGLNITWYQYTEMPEEEAKNQNYSVVTVNDVTYAEIPTNIYVQNTAQNMNKQNDINISGIKLLSGDNLFNVIRRLVYVYFDRETLSFSAINNGEYKPGQLYTVPTGIGSQTITGYITSADFSFGKNARSSMMLKKVSSVQLSYTITFNYIYGVESEHPELLDSWSTTAYLSSIISRKNPIIDKTYRVWGANPARRVIYYATDGKNTVIEATQNTTKNINYDKALAHINTASKSSLGRSFLEINRVDSATISEEAEYSGRAIYWNVLVLK